MVMQNMKDLNGDLNITHIGSENFDDLVYFDQRNNIGISTPPDIFKSYIDDLNKFGFVCYYKRRIVGYITIYNREGKKYELTKIFVLPNYRRLGIGTRLIDKVCKIISELGPKANRKFVLSKLIYAGALFDGAEEFFENNYFVSSKFGYCRLLESTKIVEGANV